MGVWLGRKRIPPLPHETVLTDRSDGQRYRVDVIRAFDPRVDRTPEAFAMTGEIDRNRYRVYDAFTGPIIFNDDNEPFRLYVDGGSLGFERA